jgi:HSP20 family protein
MDPKNVEVEITDGFLTIKGQREEKKEEKDKEGSYLRREMSFGSFLRTVALPETADFDKAEASFRNGILTITVKKKAAAIAKPKKVAVKQAA